IPASSPPPRTTSTANPQARARSASRARRRARESFGAGAGLGLNIVRRWWCAGRAGEGVARPVPIKRASGEARPDGAQPPRSSARAPRGARDPFPSPTRTPTAPDPTLRPRNLHQVGMKRGPPTEIGHAIAGESVDAKPPGREAMPPDPFDHDDAGARRIRDARREERGAAW